MVSCGHEHRRHFYIVQADGICSDCGTAVQNMLASGGIESEILSPLAIVDRLTTEDVLIAPGGYDYDAAMADLANVGADAVITNHVNDGGTYIGHCLGADLAPLLHIFPGTVTDPAPIKTPLAVTTVWSGQRRTMYFEDGPRFSPTAPVTVLATFGSDRDDGIPGGEPAAIKYDWGKGRVGLISPHPEANSDWMSELGSSAPTDLDYDLGLAFYAKVLAD